MRKIKETQIWTLYYEGYSTREIAEELDLEEYYVVSILYPNK